MGSVTTTQGGQVVSGTDSGNKHGMDVAVISTVGSAGPNFTWDAYTRNDTGTTDVWEFRTGGAAGTIVATLTITYTDSTKTEETQAVWS